MEPLGTRTRNGLWTGHDVRGPQRDEEGPCIDMLLMLFELHGLKLGGGGTGAAGSPRLRVLRPLMLRQWPPPIAEGGGGIISSIERPAMAMPLSEMCEPSRLPLLWPPPPPDDIIDCASEGGIALPCGHMVPAEGAIDEQFPRPTPTPTPPPPPPPTQPCPTAAAPWDEDHCTQPPPPPPITPPPPPPLPIPAAEAAALRRLFV